MNQIPDSHTKQPLFSHIAELRNRLLWTFLAMGIGTYICYHFVEYIYGFLVMPLAHAMGPNDSQRLIYTNLTEAFFTYLKVSIFAGSFLTFPILISQIWMFVAPGLFPSEKRAALPFLIASPLLFLCGGALVYYVVVPFAWTFFLSFQSSGTNTVLPIELEARVGEYLDLIMTLIFAFGLCFQLPVIMALLAKAGFVTAEKLVKFRRYAIVIIFAVAAVLTPPDVLSMLSLAFPLWGLYEISILIIRIMKKTAHVTNAA